MSTAHDLQGRWERLPKPTRTVLTVVGVVVALFLIRVLPDLLFEDGSSGWWIYLGVLLVLAAVALVVARRMQASRLGGADQARGFRRAFRTGEVPPDADHATWVPEAQRVLRAGRRGQTYQRVSAAGLALLTVLIAIIAIVADLPTGGRVAFGVLAVALAAVTWFTLWVGRFNHDRAQRLVDRLEGPTDLTA